MKIDPREVFLVGEEIILKVLTEKDVLESGWFGWFNDQSNCETNGHHYWPNTIEAQLNFFKNMNSDNKIQLGVVSKILPQILKGVVSLQDISLLHRRADLAILIDVKEENNVKIFFEAFDLMLTHGFLELGLNKVTSGSTRASHAKTLERLWGFELEGTLKRHFYKHGEYLDVTCMALHREVFLAKRGKNEK
jgi:RimJ/RimL family protein N-acetyltransferase